MERIKRIATTIRGRVLIEDHMLRRSQEVAWDCRNRAACTYRVATIRLLLSSDGSGSPGANARVCQALPPGPARLSHDRHARPLTGSERKSRRSWCRLRPAHY